MSIRILITDDHGVIRAGLRALLGGQPDMEVVGEASDGREVLSKTVELKPDVVLMDLSMPNMGGLEATRQLSKIEPNARILILTVHEDESLLKEVIRSGADGTIQPLQKADFEITVLDEWRSPHTQGVYPAAWEIRLNEPNCRLEVHPWMADQEINFPAVTYWEGAVHFEGICNGAPARGNGYIELTGYAGNLPLP